MERASSSSSTGWEIIPGIQEVPAASVPEVMAGSFCREKEFSNILEVKEDESEYLLRFKGGSEEWVANDELDETTKEFFKLAKPVKRALNIHNRKQVKIEHVQTKMIHKISTSGINNVQELKKRYTDNAGCNAAIDLYTKDKETDQLIMLAPKTLLPLKTNKVFACNSPLRESIGSSIEHPQGAKLSPMIVAVSSVNIQSLELNAEEKMSPIASKSPTVVRKELTTTEAASEVIGAVGGSGGEGIGARCGESTPLKEMPVTHIDVGPKIKMTDSICAKMSDEQKMKLAMKMSEGTMTVKDLEDALNSKQVSGGGGNILKQMVSAFTDIFGSNTSPNRARIDEPESKNSETCADIVQAALAPPTSVSVNDSIRMSESKEASVKNSLNISLEVPHFEAKAVDQEQKPVEESEEVFDIVIEAQSIEKKPQTKPELDARPIIHSQPLFDNSPDMLNEWLQSLAKIYDTEEMHAAVAEKIVEMEIAHAIKLSEMENRHKVLVSSLREIIKRQASEKGELVLMMKENKKALLTAIEAQLDDANTKFEHVHQSFFQERNKQLEALNTNLEKQAIAPIKVGEERKVPDFQKFEPVQENGHDKKQSEPMVVVDENPVEFLSVEPEPAIFPIPAFTQLPNCPGEHGLTRIVHWNAQLVCDECDYMVKQNTEIFSCRPCNFDICGKCFRNRWRAKKSVLELEVAPRGAFVDDDGNDSKKEDDVEVKIIEEVKKPFLEEIKGGNIIEDQKDEEEIIQMSSMEDSLELVNVELTKGGFTSEQMEIRVEMKNIGAIPIQCLASLNMEGDSCGLVFIGFKTSLQEDTKVIRLDVAPGDVCTAVIEFHVPYNMEPKKYDFDWQLNEYETGQKVGPMFSLKNLVLHKPLDNAEQEEKVRRLCSMGLGTREEVIQALDSNDWDLNQAVNEFFPQ